MICGVWRPGEIRFDGRIVGAPVPQVLEYGIRVCPAGLRERMTSAARERLLSGEVTIPSIAAGRP